MTDDPNLTKDLTAELAKSRAEAQALSSKAEALEDRLDKIEAGIGALVSKGTLRAEKRLYFGVIKEIDGFLLLFFLVVTLLLTWDANRRSIVSDDVIASHIALDATLDAALNVTAAVSAGTANPAEIRTQLSTLRHRVASGANRVEDADDCIKRLVAHVDLLSRGRMEAYTPDRQPIGRDALIFNLAENLRGRLDAWRNQKTVPIIGYFRDPPLFRRDVCFVKLED